MYKGGARDWEYGISDFTFIGCGQTEKRPFGLNLDFDLKNTKPKMEHKCRHSNICRGPIGGIV